MSDVVGRKVALKRKGREFVGLSPFKAEKTPSFFVNDHKGFYHCFSTGEHGDVFTFLMKSEGLSFPEAVERLALHAGVELPKRDALQEKREAQRASLHDIMQAAALYFRDQLASSAGAEARRYLARRGLSDETLEEFCFGFAPAARDALRTALTRRGYSEEELIECGLLFKPDTGGAPFDRFRNRVMIPIHDQRGRVIAFGGRALTNDVQPKYLNSPETTMFHKGSVVFNFHRARQTAFEQDEVVVVEGYLDAIAIYQAGIKNVVATLGTAFTEEQIAQLWRLSDSPLVCFDGDRAGEEAAYRAIDKILAGLEVGRTFRFVFMDGAKDPDDLIREQGVEAFNAVLRSAMPLHDALWSRELRKSNIDTPEAKAALERRYYSAINTIKDASVRRHYVTTFRIRLSKFFWDNEKHGRPALYKHPTDRPREEALDQAMMGLAVEYPELFESFWERLRSLHMASRYEEFRQALIDVILSSDDRLVATIYAKIDPNFYSVLEEVHGDEDKEKGLVRGHRFYDRCKVVRQINSDEFIAGYFELHVMLLELRAEETEVEDVVQDFGRDATEANWMRLQALKRQIDRRREQIHALERELDELRQAHRSKSDRAAA